MVFDRYDGTRWVHKIGFYILARVKINLISSDSFSVYVALALCLPFQHLAFGIAVIL